MGFPKSSVRRICLLCRRLRLDSWVRKICWRRERLPTSPFLDSPCDSADKESTCNVRDLGSVLGLGRSLGEGKGYPLQYSGHGMGSNELDTTEWLLLSLCTDSCICNKYSFKIFYNYCLYNSYAVHGVLNTRILQWFAIPFSSGPHAVRPLHHDPSILGGPTQHALVLLS